MNNLPASFTDTVIETMCVDAPPPPSAVQTPPPSLKGGRGEGEGVQRISPPTAVVENAPKEGGKRKTEVARALWGPSLWLMVGVGLGVLAVGRGWLDALTADSTLFGAPLAQNAANAGGVRDFWGSLCADWMLLFGFLLAGLSVAGAFFARALLCFRGLGLGVSTAWLYSVGNSVWEVLFAHTLAATLSSMVLLAAATCSMRFSGQLSRRFFAKVDAPPPARRTYFLRFVLLAVLLAAVAGVSALLRGL